MHRYLMFGGLEFSSELHLKRWRASPWSMKVSMQFNLSIEGSKARQVRKIVDHIPSPSPEKLASTLFRVYSRHFSASSKEE